MAKESKLSLPDWTSLGHLSMLLIGILPMFPLGSTVCVCVCVCVWNVFELKDIWKVGPEHASHSNFH
jgi:hypothetical protein